MFERMLMMLSPSSILLFVSLFTQNTSARPSPPRTSGGATIPLTRRTHAASTWDEQLEWAKAHKANTEAKYGSASQQTRKRNSGTNLIVNQNADSTFYGTIALGTPPTPYNVILDTGSSDLWVADASCGTAGGCTSIPSFTPSSSSTFKNLTTPFQVTYGSGRAVGTLCEDTIQMAGFSVGRQKFALVDQTTGGLLQAPVAGLMGLAWQPIASSGATPFWQNLAASGTWDSPVMAFALTRFLNASHAKDLEPGGSFTMGFTDTSLYTGSIEYTNIPGGQGTYWILPMTSLTVNGAAVPLPSGTDSYAAIDTGTTLVGGPPDTIAEIYAQIPGSQPLTGDYAGYYTFPCKTSVTVGLAFGGATTWAISPADFALPNPRQDSSGNTCLGAFFGLTTGSSAPAWIVGDTFLKNVYSVFQFQPPSVGFASLASAQLKRIEAGSVPSATIGSVATEVSASTNFAVPSWTPSMWSALVVVVASLSVLA